jgi:hypothetical protein
MILDRFIILARLTILAGLLILARRSRIDNNYIEKYIIINSKN